MTNKSELTDFDQIFIPPVPFDDVAKNYATPRHLSRRDMRRHNRSRKIDRWNRELMLFGIVMGATCVFLFAVYVFAVGVMNR